MLSESTSVLLLLRNPDSIRHRFAAQFRFSRVHGWPPGCGAVHLFHCYLPAVLLVSFYRSAHYSLGSGQADFWRRSSSGRRRKSSSSSHIHPNLQYILKCNQTHNIAQKVHTPKRGCASYPIYFPKWKILS